MGCGISGSLMIIGVVFATISTFWLLMSLDNIEPLWVRACAVTCLFIAILLCGVSTDLGHASECSWSDNQK